MLSHPSIHFISLLRIPCNYYTWSLIDWIIPKGQFMDHELSFVLVSPPPPLSPLTCSASSPVLSPPPSKANCHPWSDLILKICLNSKFDCTRYSNFDNAISLAATTVDHRRPPKPIMVSKVSSYYVITYVLIYKNREKRLLYEPLKVESRRIRRSRN